MDWILLLAVVGSAASIVGLPLAGVQTIRFRRSERDNGELRRNRNLQIWGNIVLALEVFDRLEPLKTNSNDMESLSNDVRSRIIGARQTVVNQYLRLLEQAILAEDNFSHETVKLWSESGRLDTDWRRAQAMKFVETGSLESINLDGMGHGK